MAKSDPDSNGLWQDQPECAGMNPALAGDDTLESVSHLSSIGCSATPNRSSRPDVTEPPGLTSDPICTADRRGGILISFGPEWKPRRVINPSNFPGPPRGELNVPRSRFAFHPSALLHLRASDSPRRRQAICRPEVETSRAQRPTLVRIYAYDAGVHKGVGPTSTAGCDFPPSVGCPSPASSVRR